MQLSDRSKAGRFLSPPLVSMCCGLALAATGVIPIDCEQYGVVWHYLVSELPCQCRQQHCKCADVALLVIASSIGPKHLLADNHAHSFACADANGSCGFSSRHRPNSAYVNRRPNIGNERIGCACACCVEPSVQQHQHKGKSNHKPEAAP